MAAQAGPKTLQPPGAAEIAAVRLPPQPPPPLPAAALPPPPPPPPPLPLSARQSVPAGAAAPPPTASDVTSSAAAAPTATADPALGPVGGSSPDVGATHTCESFLKPDNGATEGQQSPAGPSMPPSPWSSAPSAAAQATARIEAAQKSAPPYQPVRSHAALAQQMVGIGCKPVSNGSAEVQPADDATSAVDTLAAGACKASSQTSATPPSQRGSTAAGSANSKDSPINVALLTDAGCSSGSADTAAELAAAAAAETPTNYCQMLISMMQVLLDIAL